MLDPVSETTRLAIRSGHAVRCLACLEPVLEPVLAGEHCSACRTPLPLRYGQYQFEPLALPLLGGPKTGKTTYVEALLALLPRLTRIWQGFGFSPATDHTRDSYREALRRAVEGALPPPTVLKPPTARGTGEPATLSLPAKDEPTSSPPPRDDAASGEPANSEQCIPPLALLLHGLPGRWQLPMQDGMLVHRALSLHDTPGSDSERLCLPVKRLRLLQRSRRCLMFFSLPEIERAGGAHLSMLFDAYTETLIGCPRPADLHGRQEVIVVFTQAEKATSLPADLRGYLLKDPLWTYLRPRGAGEMAAGASRRTNSTSTLAPKDQVDVDFDDTRLSEYLRGMKHTSHLLDDWLCTIEGGTNFLRLARDYGVKLRLTLVSATGADPIENTVIGGWQPHRVLDPLFWALELDAIERQRAEGA